MNISLKPQAPGADYCETNVFQETESQAAGHITFKWGQQLKALLLNHFSIKTVKKLPK